MKPVKKKNEKISTLKARLWRLTSEYVRRSNMTHSGLVRCVTCFKWHPYAEIHAGHFLPKKKGSAVYFDLRNIHPQCAGCNIWKRGNIHSYYDYMLNEYGQVVIDELKALSHHPLKYTRDDYHLMIDDMRRKLLELS